VVLTLFGHHRVCFSCFWACRSNLAGLLLLCSFLPAPPRAPGIHFCQFCSSTRHSCQRLLCLALQFCPVSSCAWRSVLPVPLVCLALISASSALVPGIEACRLSSALVPDFHFCQFCSCAWHAFLSVQLGSWHSFLPVLILYLAYNPPTEFLYLTFNTARCVCVPGIHSCQLSSCAWHSFLLVQLVCLLLLFLTSSPASSALVEYKILAVVFNCTT
jgi:hypothetical protein